VANKCSKFNPCVFQGPFIEYVFWGSFGESLENASSFFMAQTLQLYSCQPESATPHFEVDQLQLGSAGEQGTLEDGQFPVPEKKKIICQMKSFQKHKNVTLLFSLSRTDPGGTIIAAVRQKAHHVVF
jgi:hypothetical protein